MRIFVRLLALLALAAAAGGGWWYLRGYPGTLDTVMATVATWTGIGAKPADGAKPPPGASPAAGFAMPVEAAPVTIGPVARRITAVGSLLSSESVVLRPEVAGRVVEILFTEGQRVTKGQPLVRLDDAVPRAILIEMKATLTLSEAEYQRAEELYRQGSGSLRTRDQTQSKLLVDRAEATLAQVRLEKLTLNAPFDGVVGLRRFSVGDYVKEGQDLVNLEAIDSLKLDFRVPEAFVTAVKPGQSLTLAVDAVPDRSFAGEVFAIDPLIDVNGRSLSVRARVENHDLILRPGLFARITLNLTERPKAVLVPEQALFAFGRDQFVFAVVDGKATQTKVSVGARREAMVEITQGLKPDDVVITSGQIKIRNGMAVSVIGPAQAGG
ncbi:MAG: efflux RND transporter periplasmic adaptor subunit [Azospirillum sp.]|nr:efflux RND transporter periplasmic adaptor subunit [Azospirillum sp.]